MIQTPRANTKMKRAMILLLIVTTSPAFAVDEVTVRRMEHFLDFVALLSANCVQHLHEGYVPNAAARLSSPEDIAAYCVCSTKLVERSLGGADFESIEAGNGLPAALLPALKLANYECARKVWDSQRRQ
jgi:hypothetical protein